MKTQCTLLVLTVICMFFGCTDTHAGGVLSSVINGGAGAPSEAPTPAPVLSAEEQLHKREHERILKARRMERVEASSAKEAFIKTDQSLGEAGCHSRELFDRELKAISSQLARVEKDTTVRDTATMLRLRPLLARKCTCECPALPVEMLTYIGTFLSTEVTSMKKLRVLFIILRLTVETFNTSMMRMSGEENWFRARNYLSPEARLELAQNFCIVKEFVKSAIGLMRDTRPAEDKIKHPRLIDEDEHFEGLDTALTELYSRVLPKIRFDEIPQNYYSPTAEPPAELFAAAT